MAAALTAYAHYMAMSAIAVLLVAQLMLCAPGMESGRIHVLARLDRLYLVAALVALVSGLARLLWLGKGWAFYAHNPVFYMKIALFIALGLISIPPTLQYLHWRRSADSASNYRPATHQTLKVRRYIVVQLILFALIPLMATFMARGIGSQTPAS